MKYSAKTITLILTLIMTFSFSTLCLAGPGIKERMKSRLPAIMNLKAKGIIGENNQGYLEFVGKSKEQAGLVAAENADRKKVYTAIAKKNKTTVQNVGVRRALQIAEKARPGHWIKSADGKWSKK